jgi:hypothetical protein
MAAMRGILMPWEFNRLADGLNLATQSVQEEGANRRGSSMRTFVATMIFALVAGPAFAQFGGISLLPDEKAKTPEEIQRGQAIDNAYNSAIKKVPEQKKATNDPWADVRGASQPPSVQKPARSSASSKSN